jgi:hypothetical protein
MPHVWSDAINGLSGRLVVEFEDLGAGVRHAIYAQLRNLAPLPIVVTSQPLVEAEVRNSAGKSIPGSGFPVSGPAARAHCTAIPLHGYVALRIDEQTVGMPLREKGLALIALGGKSWGVGAGNYTLKVRLELTACDDAAPRDPWIGKLDLPPLDLVVSTGMLTGR